MDEPPPVDERLQTGAPKRAGRGPIGTAASLVLALAILAAAGGFSLMYGLHAGDWAEPRVRDFVFWQLRLPRLLMGLLVGATLSIVGAAFQTLFQNPLATPSTVGTTAGATLGALFSLVLGLESTFALSAVTLCSFAGALCTSALVLALASRKTVSIEEILLAGIAVTLGSGAIAQGLHTIADASTLFSAAKWSLGQLPQVGFQRLAVLAVPALVCASVILSQRKSLLVLGLGEERARSVGVETERVRLWVLIAGCLGVGASVALCGPIAFVGLLVPHLVRLAVGPPGVSFLVLCWWWGGAFLVTCDTLAHFAFPGRELPVGVITASLGSPALFLLILRGRGGSSWRTSVG